MGDGGFGEFRQDYHGLHIPEAEARLSQLIEHILPVYWLRRHHQWARSPQP